MHAVFIAVMALLLVLPTGALAQSTPGTGVSAGPVANPEAIAPVISESGHISWSLDGAGTNLAAGRNIRVLKPAGATVRRAFLAAASTGFSGRRLNNGDVSLDGVPMVWSISLANSISSWNHWTEITTQVKTKVDAAAAGIVNFHVDEVGTGGVEGEGLFVIFDDPAQLTDNTVALLFGAQNTTGDTFNVRFAQPLDTTIPGFGIDLSLGISFGFQPSGQFSLVDVNGARLTSCAGGQDDGEPANGALITVGGIDDLTTNPAPNCTDAAGPRSDDELYSLIPFVHSGDTTLTVHTVNPSNDDNIFFAGFWVRGATAVVGEGIVLSPASATNPTGALHTVTASLQDTLGHPLVGRVVTFRVTAGPNAGLTAVAVSDTNGQATFTYTSASPGTDSIQASFTGSSGATLTSNTVTKTWTQATVTNHSLALDGTTGYAEVAPAGANLNITGNWTVESWFKDEDPNGFNHDFRQILMKGDKATNPDAPYFVLIGRNSILGGVRAGGVDYPITANLVFEGLDPAKWHHVAITFRADLNVLNLWLDGRHIRFLQVPTHSTTGNTSPLEIGRNGAVTAKYWMGKLDDTRIWNIARSGADITATFNSEFATPPANLVSNWKYNESSGLVASDSADANPAALHGGASFSTDVHP